MRLPSDLVANLGRQLGGSVWERVMDCVSYDPESDRKVLWAREVLAAARRGEPRCMASAELEATVAFALGRQEAVVGPCGKDLAAGESWDG